VAHVGHGVAVVDLMHAERTQHTLVLTSFVLLESINDTDSMETSEEIDQLAVLFNISISALNGSLQIYLHSVLGVLALEEVLETSFVEFKFIELPLVSATLCLNVELLLHDILTSLQTLKHAQAVQLLSLHPDVSITVGVLVTFEGLVDFLFSVTNSGVSKETLVHIAVTVVVDGDVLVLHEGEVHPQVVFVLLVMMRHHLFHVLFGFLHH